MIKAFALVGLLCLNMPAYAYYCSHNTTSGFVQVGYTMEQVQQQCGPPSLVETCIHQLTDITNTTYHAPATYKINSGLNTFGTINPPTSTNPTSTLGRTINITIWQYDKGPNLPAVLIEFHNGRLFQAPLHVANNPCTNN